MAKGMKYKIVLFDLFFTLIKPLSIKGCNEFDILNISEEEWIEHAENSNLYLKRIKGEMRDEFKIIEAILLSLKIDVDEEIVRKVLDARISRLTKSLIAVDEEILFILNELKRQNVKLILVSNADVIDIKNWQESPLCRLFDDVFFSCEVGLIKPDISFYEYVLNANGISKEECLFIGDGGDDELLGALNAGIHVAQATYFYNRKELSYSNDITFKINSKKEIISTVL